MRDSGPVRVVAYQAWPEIDAREARALNREMRHFLVRHLEVQRHRLEARAAGDQRLEAIDVGGLDQLEVRQALQRIVDVVDLFGYQLELVGRAVLGKDAALAVEDQPANRRHGLDTHPVALRPLREVLVVDDLQLHQPHNHDRKEQSGDDRCEDNAGDEDASLGMVVLYRGQQAHVRPGAGRDSGCRS